MVILFLFFITYENKICLNCVCSFYHLKVVHRLCLKDASFTAFLAINLKKY